MIGKLKLTSCLDNVRNVLPNSQFLWAGNTQQLPGNKATLVLVLIVFDKRKYAFYTARTKKTLSYPHPPPNPPQ
jgi:hypothetical protein